VPLPPEDIDVPPVVPPLVLVDPPEPPPVPPVLVVPDAPAEPELPPALGFASEPPEPCVDEPAWPPLVGE
jgi:hypothetical protein